MDIISFLLLILLVIIPAIPLIQKYKKRKKVAQIIDVLGGDKHYPIIGTNLCLLRAGRKNFWKTYLQRNKRNAPLFRSWMGPIPVIHLMKPDHIEAVLNSSENVNKGPNYKFLHPWFGRGLLTSEKTKWRIHRKLLTPTFHFSILDNFIEIFALKSQMLADQLLPFAEGKFFDVYPFLTHCALDIICETAMGVKINSMKYCNSEYVQAVYGVLEKVIERTFNPLYHNDFLYNLSDKGRQHRKYIKILHGFTEKVIKERQEEMSRVKPEATEEEKLLGKKQRLAFLDLLLLVNETNENFNLSLEDIRDEVDTFMFGGHDSSTVTSCWTLFLLGHNKDIQEKLFQELDDIFHGEERPVTPQDLLEMKYLERIIKETLRLYTAVPAITRQLSREIVIDGHTIPPGVMTVLHFYELHRNPEQFPDPERFDPDRFLPENMQNRHPFAYVPFSAGPRNCIGQKFAMRNIKTLIATLMRKYRVSSLKRPEEVDCFFDLFLRPQEGLQISLELRTK